MFCAQSAQRPPRPHTFPGRAAQSALPRHWTQLDELVSHTGVDVPAHCALEEHPARQEKSCGSQIGIAVPQSAFPRHCTHCPVPAKQRGRFAGQSALTAHCTHSRVAGAHTLLPPLQSAAVVQPTHSPTPELAMQRGALPGQPPPPAPPPAVHAAWHRWSPGQHDGVAAEHCASARHSAH